MGTDNACAAAGLPLYHLARGRGRFNHAARVRAGGYERLFARTPWPRHDIQGACADPSRHGRCEEYRSLCLSRVCPADVGHVGGHSGEGGQPCLFRLRSVAIRPREQPRPASSRCRRLPNDPHRRHTIRAPGRPIGLRSGACLAQLCAHHHLAVRHDDRHDPMGVRRHHRHAAPHRRPRRGLYARLHLHRSVGGSYAKR